MPPTIAELHISGPGVILVPTLRALPEVHLVVQYQATADEFGLVVHSEDFDAFEAAVAEDPTVAELALLADFTTTRIYQVHRAVDRRGISETLSDLNIQVLSTTSEPGDDGWVFRMRCRDRSSLTAFRDWATEHGLEVRLDTLYTETEPESVRSAVQPRLAGLTPRQREVLVLAYERGYFRTPREVSLDELGEELGVTGSTVSGLLRRAVETVVAEQLEQ